MNYTVITLVATVAAFLTLRIVLQYSCSLGVVAADFFLPQLLWLPIALGAGGIAASLDYRWLNRKKVALSLLGLGIVALVLVLIPGVGTRVNGANRWLLGTQPSEFAKVALLIYLAHYCASHLSKMKQRNQGFLIPMAALGLIAGLIFLEPDWGTAVLIALAGVCVLVIAGTHLGYLLVAGVIGTELLVIALCRDPHRLARILSFLDPERYRETAGWQAWTGMLALGCGGWTGVGLGEGRLKLGFLPEHHTDFILAVIGEELGLRGTGLVLFGFATLLVCGLRIAWRAPDAFGQLLAVGLTSLISLQAFINIGVVTSALPNKGMPLPFLSCGGSNLVAMLTCVGLLIGIARRIPARAPVRTAPQPPRQHPVPSVLGRAPAESTIRKLLTACLAGGRNYISGPKQ